MDLARQFFPQIMGQAARFVGMTAGRRVRLAARGADRLVNGEDRPLAVNLALRDASSAHRVVVTVFGGAPADTFNADGQPSAVPTTTTESTVTGRFTRELPANSLTILRLAK